MDNFILLLSIISILIMIYGLVLVFAGRKNFSGGIVGKKWSLLTGLVILFTLGYLTTPFISYIPDEYFKLITATILFFGAIFVIITIQLIQTIIKELMS